MYCEYYCFVILFYKKMKKIFSTFLLSAVLFFPFALSAQTSSEVLSRISDLLKIIQQLQNELQILQSGQGNEWCYDFNQNIRIGDRGSSVSALHAALQKEGFFADSVEFNERTAAAVVGFQEKYKSEILTPYALERGTGFVGPSTRAKLNRLYGCGNVALNRLTDSVSSTSQPNQSAKISVVSPRAGERYQRGTVSRISWKYSPLPPQSGFAISLQGPGQYDPGNWIIKGCNVPSTQGDGVSANEFWYDWRVGFDSEGREVAMKSNYRDGQYHNDYLDGQYVVEVYACWDGRISGKSPTFSLDKLSPSINVIEPSGAKGGQDLKLGSYQNIEWMSNDVDTVLLHLCGDSGRCLIIDSDNGFPAKSGKHLWYVDPNHPFVPGYNLRVKITDAKNSSVFGYSGYFDMVR